MLAGGAIQRPECCVCCVPARSTSDGHRAARRSTAMRPLSTHRFAGLLLSRTAGPSKGRRSRDAGATRNGRSASDHRDISVSRQGFFCRDPITSLATSRAAEWPRPAASPERLTSSIGGPAVGFGFPRSIRQLSAAWSIAPVTVGDPAMAARCGPAVKAPLHAPGQWGIAAYGVNLVVNKLISRAVSCRNNERGAGSAMRRSRIDRGWGACNAGKAAGCKIGASRRQ